MAPTTGGSGDKSSFRVLPGTLVGHYEVLAELGRGGMGLVYRARDRTLDRLVALKRPWPALVSDSATRHRFLREARAAARLSHPHVVPVFEVLEEDGVPWIVMDLVEGSSLRTRIDGAGALPLNDVLRHAENLADALDAAHRSDILHRDVNPNNIMVTTDGRALLADFGLARLVDTTAGEEASTRSHDSGEGRVVGTPGYMSPEQALGRPLDARTDIFSFGAVLYEMWTGNRAFGGPGRGAILDAVLHGRPAEVRRSGDPASQELRRIIDKALAKNPDERYQTARDLLGDLRGLRRQVEHQDYSKQHPSRGWARLRGPRAALTAGLGLLALAVSVSIIRCPPPPPPPPFDERDFLLITDFENTTGDSIFDETLREGLTVSLNQSRHVNVFPRSRVAEALKRMKRDPVTAVDGAVGREICRREDVRVLLGGSIRRAGDAFQIRIQATEPTSGRLLFAESEQFAVKDQLFARVDALALRVRRNLGESLAGIEKASRPLEKATTHSLEALQLFSKARSLRRQGELAGAETLFRSALERDPRFAMAHLYLGELYNARGDMPRTREQLTLAYGMRSEVTERERYIVDAKYFEDRSELGKAVESLKALVSLYPDDRDAHQELAVACLDAWDFAGAIREEREVLRLDPRDTDALGNLGLFLARVNAVDEAVATYEEARRKGLASPYFGWGLGLARLGQGEVDPARAAFRTLEDAEGYRPLSEYYLARTAIYEGKFGEAAGKLTSDIRRDEKENNQVYLALRRSHRARVRWFQGDKEGARRDLEPALTLAGETHGPYQLLWAGGLWAEMGDVTRARRAAEKLKGIRAEELSPFEKACLQDLEGEIALAEGRVTEAIAHFLAGAAERPLYQAQWGLARAYQARRDWKGAESAWRSVITARGEILQIGYPADWVVAHLELGRTRLQLGDAAGARKDYDTFLSLWGNADRSPLLDQAREERIHLGDAPPTS